NRVFAVESEAPERRLNDLNRRRTGALDRPLGIISITIPSPCPRVPQPDCRQQMEYCRLRPAVCRGYPNQNIVRRGLRVLDLNIEITALIEDTGILEFELAIAASTPPVLFDEAQIGELRMRIFVEGRKIG